MFFVILPQTGHFLVIGYVLVVNNGLILNFGYSDRPASQGKLGTVTLPMSYSTTYKILQGGYLNQIYNTAMETHYIEKTLTSFTWNTTGEGMDYLTIGY